MILATNIQSRQNDDYDGDDWDGHQDHEIDQNESWLSRVASP